MKAIIILLVFFVACTKQDVKEQAGREEVTVTYDAEADGDIVYTIEGSNDGRNFSPILSSTKHSDTLVFTQQAGKLYRLKMDENGSFTYSPIR